MNYYKRHIGDYYKKAGRLSMLQHGAYTLLMDACYDRERSPTLDDAISWSWASSPEEVEAVKFVLSKFFTLENGVYKQFRVAEEVELYKISSLMNQLIALSREARKKKHDSFCAEYDNLRLTIKNNPLSKSHAAWSSVIDALIKTHEASPNHKPLTTNHKPLTNIKDKEKQKAKPAALDFSILEFNNEQVEYFKMIRKANKGSKLTQRIINSLAKEFKAASAKGYSMDELLTEWEVRGWQSFKSDWITPRFNNNQMAVSGHNLQGKIYESGDL